MGLCDFVRMVCGCAWLFVWVCGYVGVCGCLSGAVDVCVGLRHVFFRLFIVLLFFDTL